MTSEIMGRTVHPCSKTGKAKRSIDKASFTEKNKQQETTIRTYI